MNKDKLIKVLEDEYRMSNVTDIDLFRSSPDNEVFKVIDNGSIYAVRLGKKTSSEDMVYEASLLAELYTANILVPEIISTQKDQKYVITEGMPMIVSCWVPGIHPSELTAQHFYQIGKWMGEFHQKGLSIELPHPRKRNLFLEINDFLEHEDVFLRKTTNGPVILDHVKRVVSEIKNIKSTEGIIHNDLRPHNVLFMDDGSLSAVLDFDWACTGSLEKDVAHTIMEWTCPDGSNVSCDIEGARVIYSAYEKASGMKMSFSDLALWAEFSGIADACTYWMRVIINNSEITDQVEANSFMYDKAVYFSDILKRL